MLSYLAAEILDISERTGTFRLRSGHVTDRYFDKYQFEAQPRLLRSIAAHLAPLIPADTEVLAGVQLGGIPLATALSLQTDFPLAFVRTERKTYGTERIVEGADVAGRVVCLVEDVITTGGAVRAAAAVVRAEGGVVFTTLCVIWRGTDAARVALADGGLHIRSICTAPEPE